MFFFYIPITILGFIVILSIYFYLKNELPLRKREDGFEYVHVELDGTVRELNEEEQKYLLEEFHPNDGDRPYIKTSYEQLTPDNKIWGFIKRKRVPKHIIIKPYIKNEN